MLGSTEKPNDGSRNGQDEDRRAQHGYSNRSHILACHIVHPQFTRFVCHDSLLAALIKDDLRPKRPNYRHANDDHPFVSEGFEHCDRSPEKRAFRNGSLDHPNTGARNASATIALMIHDVARVSAARNGSDEPEFLRLPSGRIKTRINCFPFAGSIVRRSTSR